ncbi:hypothetical protein [Streptomyces sp. NPDC001970]
MTDYGHELLFGTIITPIAHDPTHAVALAEFTEAAGLDVATFQNHPYNSDFLDTVSAEVDGQGGEQRDSVMGR